MDGNDDVKLDCKCCKSKNVLAKKTDVITITKVETTSLNHINYFHIKF